MKLTKEQAIDYSIELWEWLAKTGKRKEDWGEWKKYGEVECDCFLCEYDNQQGFEYCEHCPYSLKFGGCEDEDTPFHKWCNVRTPRTRKKYAKLFLEQLYQLKEGK